MESITALIESIKSKDKKVRYRALEEIYRLSCSNKSKEKTVLLSILNINSRSLKWEERYVSMYCLSRYMWKDSAFVDFKMAYHNMIRLLEDEDGRVRIAAFNALEHFRVLFIAHAIGILSKGYDTFAEDDVFGLWKDSLFLLWEGAIKSKDGEQQFFFLKCVNSLLKVEYEHKLNKKDHKKFDLIWKTIQEIKKPYNEHGYNITY